MPYLCSKNKKNDRMKTQDAIALCHYYKGEDEDKCPFTDKAKAQLWAAEMMACTHLIGMIGDKHPLDDLHHVVFSYVSKWDPYEFRKTLDKYIAVAKPTEQNIKTYSN